LGPEERIRDIEEGNRRVERDKEWETGRTRRALIMVFTYLSIGACMWAIGLPGPWLNAIIPTAAFLFSMLTLPVFKRMWLGRKGWFHLSFRAISM
jgi:hypothetical protein